MTRRLRIIAFCALLSLGLSSCGGEREEAIPLWAVSLLYCAPNLPAGDVLTAIGNPFCYVAKKFDGSNSTTCIGLCPPKRNPQE